MRKRYLAIFAKLVVSVGLLWVLFRQVDLNGLNDAIGTLPHRSIALALLALAFHAAVLAWRWHRIMELIGGRLSFLQALRLTFVGLFFSQALPSSIGGDVMRIWGVYRLGVESGLAAGSVVIERVTGLFALAILVALSLPAVWSDLGEGTLHLALLATPLIATAGLVLLASADRVPLHWLPGVAARTVTVIATSMRRIAHNPLAMVEVIALGVLSSAAAISAAYFFGRGLGIHLGILVYFALVGGAVLFSVLPISIAGWGLREAAMVVLFAAVGASADKALLVSVLFGLAMIVVSLPGGAVWFVRRSRTPTGVDLERLGPSVRPWRYFGFDAGPTRSTVSQLQIEDTGEKAHEDRLDTEGKHSHRGDH